MQLVKHQQRCQKRFISKLYHLYSCAEIAKILGISEVTARKRLSNARKALKKLMKGVNDHE